MIFQTATVYGFESNYLHLEIKTRHLIDRRNIFLFIQMYGGLCPLLKKFYYSMKGYWKLSFRASYEQNLSSNIRR